VLGVAFALAHHPLHAQPNNVYQLLKKTQVGGEGAWDYISLDAQNRHLFLSHATKVEVFDIDRDEVGG